MQTQNSATHASQPLVLEDGGEPRACGMPEPMGTTETRISIINERRSTCCQIGAPYIVGRKTQTDADKKQVCVPPSAFARSTALPSLNPTSRNRPLLSFAVVVRTFLKGQKPWCLILKESSGGQIGSYVMVHARYGCPSRSTLPHE